MADPPPADDGEPRSREPGHSGRSGDAGAGGDAGDAKSDHDRRISIVEALLLALVAVLAAYSGFSSARWGTESRLLLARGSTARTEAGAARIEAMDTRNFDASTFEAWFTAYTAGNTKAMELAARRFRPEFRAAFDAWLATDPESNPDSPPGPTYMPNYAQPKLAEADRLTADADRLYREGAEAGGNADGYVRTTVYLATVLFLVGISGHFRVRAARIGLVVIGSSLVAYATVLLLLAPRPPN